MVFFILIGASIFSLVFRAYGGDDLVHGWFEDMRRRLNQDLERQVSEINSFARSLGDVNARIRAAGSYTGGVGLPVIETAELLRSAGIELPVHLKDAL